LGEHDVAIPYSEISWMYVPGAQSSVNTASVATGAASTVDQNSAGAHPAADKAFMDAATARPYPDHAVLNITKEQLKAALSVNALHRPRPPGIVRPARSAISARVLVKGPVRYTETGAGRSSSMASWWRASVARYGRIHFSTAPDSHQSYP
jgi:hypothetical protein